MIHKEKMTAKIEGDFVIVLIGMRINQFWKIHKWLPIALSMGRMLKELYSHPELGFLSHEFGIGRSFIFVQYWRSMDQLLAYAKNPENGHLPAWKDFYKRVGTDGSVGIWHETYAIPAGSYETVYTNMPPFGLGKAGKLEKAVGRRDTASGRLHHES